MREFTELTVTPIDVDATIGIIIIHCVEYNDVQTYPCTDNILFILLFAHENM